MFILLQLLGCGASTTSSCADDSAFVRSAAGELSCARAKIPTRWIRVLAGHALPKGATEQGITAVLARHAADPAGTERWLDTLAAEARAIEATPGLPGAELRSQAVWRAVAGEGPLTIVDADLGTMVASALSIRARDDGEKLALTENDVESWIKYASLCHEAQGSGVLRLSVAAKVDIYGMVQQRFEHGDRAEMIAIAAFGPAWEHVVDRWKAASYDEQQAWIAEAPLPPPMSATSLGYVDAVIEGDVVSAAHAIHRRFGPLHFRDGPGYFTGSP